MTASALQLLGMLVACGGAAVSLVARDPRIRYGAAAVALIAAPVLVAGDVWHSTRLVDLRHHPAKLAVILTVVVIAVGVGAAIFQPLPLGVPGQRVRGPAAAGAGASGRPDVAPPRPPVSGDRRRPGEPRVLGAGRRAGRGRDGRPGEEASTRSLADRPEVVWLYRVLAATLLLYAIQSAYSADVSNAIENASFFLVPFAVMLMLLGEVRWTERILGGVLIAVAGMALVFAGVAFAEYAARDLLLSRGDLLQSNQLHLYFRVNSLFYDPNLFGRDLALTLVALGAYLAWARGTRLPIVAAIVAGILLGALALSYSISSFGALLAGLLVVAALRWSVRWALAGGAAILVCGAIFLLVSGTGQTDVGSAESSSTTTSGRVDLVRGGITLAGDRPIWGWGSGSFGAAFSRHIERAKTTVSHTEPVTVAAEQGGIGLIVYVALVVLALIVLFTGAGGSVASAATAACFAAIVVHSLGYAAFTIDPATWALLGLGVALRRGPQATASAAAPGAIGDSGGPRSPRDPRPAAV